MAKLYDDSFGSFLTFASDGNATIKLGVSVNARAGMPLGYTEWGVSLRIDDTTIMSEQQQAYDAEHMLTRFDRSGELPVSGPARQEAFAAAAAAMVEVKKLIDSDPEMKSLGVKVNRFGVRPNESVGRILQEKFGYKPVEGSLQSPEGGSNPLDEFLRS